MEIDRACRSRRLVAAARFAGAAAVLGVLIPVASARPEAAFHPQGAPGVSQVVPGFRKSDTGVAVLLVQGEIDLLTLSSLERRIRWARENGFDAVVIELDTPGGRIDAARDIQQLLKTEAPPNTVAWINPNGFSAGTLLALACREIVVHPNAAWGDCAPIAVGPMGIIPLPAAERAKMEAALRTDVVDSARRNHYDERLAEAFIALGIELWMLEHVTTGERIFADRAEYNVLFGQEPPAQFTPINRPPGSTSRVVTPWLDQRLAPGDLRDEIAMTEDEIRRQVEFGQSLPQVRPALGAAERGKWRLVTQVISNDRLLTVRAEESIDYGLAAAAIRNDAELQAFFAAPRLVRLEESWSEGMVRVLVSPWVRGVLIVLFVLSLLIEMAAPGIGLFGALAGVCLLFLIGAPFLAGMAQWWEIVLIVIGMGLIATEIFVLPGFGVAGVSGVVCLLVGVVGTFISGDLRSAQGQSELYTGLGATVSALVAGGVGVWALSRYIYEIPFFRKFILSATIEGRTTTTESVAPEVVAGPSAAWTAAVRPGDTGVAHTDLRPAGRALIGGRMIDVVAPGEYIVAGTPVRVAKVDSFSVEVEASR